MAEWDESKHPRHPGGSPEGGEFAGGGGGDDWSGVSGAKGNWRDLEDASSEDDAGLREASDAERTEYHSRFDVVGLYGAKPGEGALSEAQQLALSEYTLSDPDVYETMQEHMRTGEVHEGYEEEAQWAQSIQSAAMGRPPTETELTVYRGGPVFGAKGATKPISLKGFTSTSTSKQVAAGFTSAKGKAAAIHEIVVPKGSRGVLGGINDKETEVLLAHGGRLSPLGSRKVSLADSTSRTVYRWKYEGPDG